MVLRWFALAAARCQMNQCSAVGTDSCSIPSSVFFSRFDVAVLLGCALGRHSTKFECLPRGRVS